MPDQQKLNRVTMQDVARAAGVSQSTVSFVLNGNKDVHIAESTRERIIRTANNLGYKARSTGRARKRGVETPFMGFLIDEIATSIFGAISIEGAQEAAWKAGYVLDVAMTGGDQAYEQVVLDRWTEDGVTGVIYASILTRSVTPPNYLEPKNTVLLNCFSENAAYTAVVPSEVLGGFNATEALIDAGCQRIAFIGGEEWMDAAQDRMEGFRNALSTHDMRPNPSFIQSGNFLPSGGYDATRRLLEQRPQPDGIFCANDLMAIGAYQAIKEAGMKIPEEIRIVGYDDQELARHLTPPLTTVLLPHREMGQWAVNWLATKPETNTLSPKTIKLECPLVRRLSA